VERVAGGPSGKLTQALIQVESGGDDWAIGDKKLKKKAYGPVQVRQPIERKLAQVHAVGIADTT